MKRMIIGCLLLFVSVMVFSNPFVGTWITSKHGATFQYKITDDDIDIYMKENSQWTHLFNMEYIIREGNLYYPEFDGIDYIRWIKNDVFFIIPDYIYNALPFIYEEASFEVIEYHEELIDVAIDKNEAFLLRKW